MLYADENEDDNDGAVNNPVVPPPSPIIAAAVEKGAEPMATFGDDVAGAAGTTGVVGEGDVIIDEGTGVKLAGDGGVSGASSDTSVSDDMERCDISSDSEDEGVEGGEGGETAVAWSCGSR